eukprot:222078-Alexandrium_andersonii.AAC.1
MALSCGWESANISAPLFRAERGGAAHCGRAPVLRCLQSPSRGEGCLAPVGGLEPRPAKEGLLLRKGGWPEVGRCGLGPRVASCGACR